MLENPQMKLNYCFFRSENAIYFLFLIKLSIIEIYYLLSSNEMKQTITHRREYTGYLQRMILQRRLLGFIQSFFL